MGVKVRVGQQTGVKVPTTSSTAGGTVASLQDTDVSNVVNGSVLFMMLTQVDGLQSTHSHQAIQKISMLMEDRSNGQ